MGENKDEFASTKMSNFVWMDNIPNDMYKALKDKHICNPYGNVYRKRRMSISCPSTPIRGSFKPIAQLLAEVSEKFLEETENESHNTRCPGRRERLISQLEKVFFAFHFNQPIRYITAYSVPLWRKGLKYSLTVLVEQNYTSSYFVNDTNSCGLIFQ